MPSPTLAERARNYVAKMPDLKRAKDHPQDSHAELFKAACVCLQGFGLTMPDARSIVTEYARRSDQPWTDAEIEHKLSEAEAMGGFQTKEGMCPRGCLAGDYERDDRPSSAGRTGEALPSRAASVPLPSKPAEKPSFKAEKLREFAQRWRGVIDTAWLAGRSPLAPRTLTAGLSADDYLRAVFRDGEKVVVFTNQQSQGQAMWPLQRVPERGDEGVWYLCQPVDGLEYENPRAGKLPGGKPKMSRRSEESVTDWRHLVLESDEADYRDWLAALVQLPIRIVAIYTSGGRSIHALVRVDAKSKGDWDQIVKQIRPLFVTLGADPGAMSAVRLTRLPGCWRGEKLQKLLYLNPEPTPCAICTMPPVRDVLEDALKLVDVFVRFTPAEVKEQDGWGSVEQCLALLEWYQNAPRANEMRATLLAWMGGGR